MADSNTLCCLGVIPARYPSTRLEGKPLKDIGGKTLLQRVWEQASHARHLAKVVIATDDERIFKAASAFGAEALMTSDRHLTGSDRVAEVSAHFEERGKHFPLVANIQGDMPFVNPLVIDRTIALLAESGSDVGMSTVATPLLDEAEFQRPSAVKVVLGVDQRALYFSRAPIPHARDGVHAVSFDAPFGYKHMGLYVFRPQTLARLSQLKQSLPELREKLEQLRALCNGITIRVAIASASEVAPAIEVDTPEDLARAVAASHAFDASQKS